MNRRQTVVGAFGAAFDASCAAPSNANGHDVREGQVYVVEQAFTGLVLTQWFAPFTGGYERNFPAGLVFEIAHDPVPGAAGVSAKPSPYDEWEQRLVDAADRDAENYSGYHLVVTFDQIERFCALQR